MSRVLLRILTRKSTIGFGPFKNTTVQNLLNQRNYAALISIYYNLELITFNNDVLFELNITGDLIIEKPGKRKDMWDKYGNNIADQIRQANGLFKPESFTENPMNNYKKRAASVRRVKELSKAHNRTRNQRGW